MEDTLMTTLARLVLQWGPHHGPSGPMGPHWGAEMGPWSTAGGTVLGLVWPLFGLLLVAALVALAAAVVMKLGVDGDGDNADAILRERYARGEVTDDEFDKRAARLAVDGRSTTET